MNQHFISYYHKSLLQYLKSADIKKRTIRKFAGKTLTITTKLSRLL